MAEIRCRARGDPAAAAAPAAHLRQSARPQGLGADRRAPAAAACDRRRQVSEKHCNFLINTGAATAADIEALGEEVRRRVLEHSGVELEWEIRRIGVPAGMSGAA